MSRVQSRPIETKASIENSKLSRQSREREEAKQSQHNTLENEAFYYIEPGEPTLYNSGLFHEDPKVKAFTNSLHPGALSLVRSDLHSRQDVVIRASKVPNIEVTIPDRSLNRESSPTLINTTSTLEKDSNIKELNSKRVKNQRDLLYQSYTKPRNENYLTNKSDIDNHPTQGDTYQRGDGRIAYQSPYSIIEPGRNPNNTRYHQLENPSNEEMRLINLRQQIRRNEQTQHPVNDRNQHFQPISLRKGQRNQNEDGIKPQDASPHATIGTYDPRRGLNKKPNAYNSNTTKEGVLSNSRIMLTNENEDQSPCQCPCQCIDDAYLMAHKKSSTVPFTNNNNDIDDYVSEPKYFEPHITTEGNKTNAQASKQKFLFLSLAMINSKGPNCEDKVILRNMRYDKGGVVDLAYEATKSKGKYPVMKITRKRPPIGLNHQMANPKYREKAARVVQAWWKGLKKKYQVVYKKIVLIQSTWRGKWIRKYMYDLCYMQCLCQNFNEIIHKVIVNHFREFVFSLIKEAQNRQKRLLIRLFEKDMHFRCLKLRPYWDLWRESTNSSINSQRNREGLFQRKSTLSKEEKFKELVKAFGKYRTTSNELKDMKKLKAEEDQKKQEKGLLLILNASPNLLKRTRLLNVAYNLIRHLNDKVKQQAIPILRSSFVKRSKTINNERLRKEFSKWKAACFARNFFDKLKEIKQSKEKFNQLKSVLIQGTELIKAKRNKTLRDKIFKLYTYSILNKFANCLLKVLHQYKIPFFKRLANQILRISVKSFEQSYIKSKPSKMRLFSIVSLNFDVKLSNPKKPGSKPNSPLLYLRLLPYFAMYLKKKINANLGWSLAQLKSNCEDSKFCSLYKKHIDSQLLKLKRVMVDRLKAKSDYLNSLGYQQMKLFILLRGRMIRIISRSLLEPSRFYRLFYLIKMSLMHKNLKEKRFEREIIRKWRFMSFVKKMAKRKLETMYHNLHSNFMQMTNEVFGDTEDNPCLMTEVEHFGDKMGMFTNEPLSHSFSSEKRLCKSLTQGDLRKSNFTSQEFPSRQAKKKEGKSEKDKEEDEDR